MNSSETTLPLRDTDAAPVNPRIEDPQDIIDTIKDISRRLGYAPTRVDEMATKHGATISIGYGIGEVLVTLKKSTADVHQFRIHKEPDAETYAMLTDVLRGHARRAREGTK